MNVIQIELADDVLKDMTEIAQQTGRPITTVVQEAVEKYRNDYMRATGTHRAIDIPLGNGLGEILKPWSTRAELLEDFFDDRH